jgi:hypothetical protein
MAAVGVQYDLSSDIDGGSDAWDDGPAGVILSGPYFDHEVGSALKHWSGSAWLAASELLRWNGQAWEPVGIKRFDGARWVPV